MNIKKWMGLVSAVSPYSLPPGAAAEQNNLQNLKPGQLTPRPGMSLLPSDRRGSAIALFRQSPGGSTPDRIYRFTLDTYNDDNNLPEPLYSYSLNVLIDSAGTLTPTEILTLSSTKRLFPSFAQDRHGTIYVFFGNGLRAKTYRHGIDATAIDFGMDAPTVAPQVTPDGDSFFIERVDVLSGGSSYYTPPTITVTGGGASRSASLRAIVQSGSIVAVEVVDGGVDYKSLPTITVSNDQIGTGFLAKGTQGTTAAVYGFKDSTAITGGYPSGTLGSGYTYAFNTTADLANPKIAYWDGSADKGADATWDGSVFTALIPLQPVSPATGSGAYAQVKFTALNAGYTLGNTSISVSGSNWTAISAYSEYTTAGSVKFRASRNWYTTDNYFENTYTPANENFTNNRWKYQWQCNIDAFWGLMPNPSQRVFAKRQIAKRVWNEGDFFNAGYADNDFGNYYFPDYGKVGYRLLIGPEDKLSDEANWVVGSATVQIDGNNRPYIDVTLQPAKKPDGSSRKAEPTTVYPVVRVYLKYCPTEWHVNSTAPLTNGESWLRRYTPQSGQDRRASESDPGTSQASNTPSGVMDDYSFGNINNQTLTDMDTRKRWWGVGLINSSNAAYAMKEPVVDIRQGVNSDTAGLAADSIAIQNAGSKLEYGTKFVLRLEQYNAYEYTVKNIGGSDFSWLSSPPDRPTLATTIADYTRKGSTFGQYYMDFAFEANTLDASSAGTDISGIVPGAISGTPNVVVSGTGWLTSQSGEFLLRKREIGGTAFSDGQRYRWGTEVVTPAVTGSQIVSVTISSGGQNYYREPTILFKGGGGYGLRTQATVSGGKVTSVLVVDGGDGFTSDTILYTDVQPAKLLPIMRGTLRGQYRCAYRFADYRQTKVLDTTITVSAGSKVGTLADATGVKPGMVITGPPNSVLSHFAKIVSVSGNTVTLFNISNVSAGSTTAACTIRDMTQPVVYSDFSPILDVDASAGTAGRAARMIWSVAGVVAPPRAEYVEFYRTSGDQSLVFYRLNMYGTVSGGTVTLVRSDAISDEVLFDLDRPSYAALPVVLPNGGLNAYRFGVGRTDMAVCVAWQDRLWYGVSTSGHDSNTVFFSELDEFESCPDTNEIPIQSNLRSSDFLTALVPFGTVLLAMQNTHCYAVSYNTEPSVDPAVTLVAHRGCFNHRCWDVCDDMLFAADERGVYQMGRQGEVEVLSESIRDYFNEGKIDLSRKDHFHLRVDQVTGILRLFLSLTGFDSTNALVKKNPHIALCYHIKNKTWWTESWPNSLLCACDYRAAGKPETVIYGAIDGGIYELSGNRDYAHSDIVSVTVSDGGSGYVTPPTITLSGDGAGGCGVELKPILHNGSVTDVIVVQGGFGYGNTPDGGSFASSVTLTFSAPPSGSTATGSATARAPTSGGTEDSPTYYRTSVPFTLRTGPMALAQESNVKGGDRMIDRSVAVTYRPTATTKTLNLREYYNNSSSPRPNVMRRDRGTGFVHETSGAKTTLDMQAARSALGLSTGMAKAQFAGRSLDDPGGADRHVAVELSCTPEDVSANSTPPEPIIYELEVRGVVDGGE